MAQTNALTTSHQSAITPAGFSEDLDLIRRTFAKDLSDDELSLFAATAHTMGLSIVRKQIHAVKRKNRNGPDTVTFQVGIDGYRSVAESHPDYAGQDGPFWCGEDGQWRDVWLKQDPPRAAKVGIFRKGFAQPVTAIALWDEYVQDYWDNESRQRKPTAMWAKMPSLMLAKCAEGLAIRKAFPAKLGGTYTTEEMAQADRESVIEARARVLKDSDRWGLGDDDDPPVMLNAPEPMTTKQTGMLYGSAKKVRDLHGAFYFVQADGHTDRALLDAFCLYVTGEKEGLENLSKREAIEVIDRLIKLEDTPIPAEMMTLIGRIAGTHRLREKWNGKARQDAINAGQVELIQDIDQVTGEIVPDLKTVKANLWQVVHGAWGWDVADIDAISQYTYDRIVDDLTAQEVVTLRDQLLLLSDAEREVELAAAHAAVAA